MGPLNQNLSPSKLYVKVLQQEFPENSEPVCRRLMVNLDAPMLQYAAI